MNLYDSHIHLCSQVYKSNLQEILQDFFVQGGKKLLSVSYDLDSAYENISIRNGLSPSNKNIIDLGLGIHPEVFSLNSDYDNTITDIEKMENTLEMLANLISANRDEIKAIGETGLDYKWITEDTSLDIDTLEKLMQLQKLSFKYHIELAKEFRLPLSIHARDTQNSNRAVLDALSIIAKEGNGSITGVFHSYTGSPEDMDTITDLGFGIGFNGIITYSSGANIRELAKRVTEDAILLETDGPELQPQSRRQDPTVKERYSVPSDILEIAEKVAEIRGQSVEKILSINERNYSRLFE